MKLIAYILSFYVIFLMTMPAVQAFSPTDAGDSCCNGCTPNTSTDHSNNSEKSQDNPYSCNPFEVCTACIGFFIQTLPVLESFNFQLNNEIQSSYSEPSSEYIPSIFQPPKIIG